MVKSDIINIKEYYKGSDNLLIVGLGDEKGINYRKNILMILKEVLSSNDYDIKVVDAFSNYFNKCRHIDSYLNNNISTYELSLINMLGTKEKIKESKNIALRSTSLVAPYLVKTANEEYLYLSSEISKSEKPIIIYSAGFNDLKDMIDTKSIKDIAKIIKDRCSKNIENILKLNSSSKICMIGTNLTENKETNKYVFLYNDIIKNICHKYNLMYVGTRSVELTDYYNNSNTNFSGYSHYLASRILKELSFNINKTNIKESSKYNLNSAGVFGVIEDIKKYEKQLRHHDIATYRYSKEQLDNEVKVLKKVIY